MKQKDELSIDIISLFNAIIRYSRFILLFNITAILASYLIIETFHKETFKESFVIGSINKKDMQAYDYIKVLNDQISSSVEDISRKYGNIFYDFELIENKPFLSKYGIDNLDRDDMVIDLFLILNDNSNSDSNNKFSQNIKFLEPELDRSIADIKGIDAQAFHTIEISGYVDNYEEIKNVAMNSFRLSEKKLEKYYETIFSKKIQVFRDLLKFKLLSLENEIINMQTSIDENNYIKYKFLKQQLEIAKKLGIEKNQLLDVAIDDKLTLTKLNINTLSENYYLKGYKAIEAEIENMEINKIDNDISVQIIELTQLKNNLNFYLNTNIYSEIMNNLPFFNKNIDFKAGVINLDSSYEITSNKLLKIIASIVLSMIISLFIVLIKLQRSNNIKI